MFAQTSSIGSVDGPVAVEGKPSDNPEERASAVIRILDAPTPATRSAPINTAELVRARAAGDMEAGQRGAPVQIERIQIEDPVKSSAKPGAPAAARSSAAQVRIVRANGDPKARTGSGAIVRLDDTARYRETTKYEADRKRRDSEKAVVVSEQAASRAVEARATPRTTEPQISPRTTEPEVTVLGSAQGRAEIAWSRPEQPAPPVVIVESPQDTLRN